MLPNSSPQSSSSIQDTVFSPSPHHQARSHLRSSFSSIRVNEPPISGLAALVMEGFSSSAVDGSVISTEFGNGDAVVRVEREEWQCPYIGFERKRKSDEADGFEREKNRWLWLEREEVAARQWCKTHRDKHGVG